MKKLILEMDKNLVENAEEVLDEMGLDIMSAIKVMLKRITREGNASFLFSNNSVKTPVRNTATNDTASTDATSDEPIKMTKNKAIALIRCRNSKASIF